MTHGPRGTDCGPLETPGNGVNGDRADYRIRGQPQPGGRRGTNGPGGPGGPGVRLPDLPPGQLFGRAVRFLRRGRAMVQVDLAARAGISLGRLSGIETGEYVAWRRAADRLARALDFEDAADLLLRFYGKDLPVADVRILLEEPPDPLDGDSL